MQVSGITTDSLIKKICFVQYGHWDDRNKALLKESMYSFWKIQEKRGESPISRQTILHWFERDSFPRRAAAISFINGYFDARVERKDDLTSSQKQVYDQIDRFFKKKMISNNAGTETSPSKQNIFLSKSRRLTVDIKQNPAEIKRIMEKFIGVYRLLHCRLVEDDNYPVSQEVMEVFLRGTEVRFKIFYNIEIGKVSEIEGVVVVTEHSLWLIGATTEGIRRIRAIVVRDIDSLNDKYNSLVWGVMTTDIPRPSSPDAVSCRIVLWKDRSSGRSLDAFKEKHVRMLSSSDIGKEPIKTMMRLIKNDITALSHAGSAAPEADKHGTIRDQVLKVNQETVENVIRRISGML